ncbi:coiled-coil domain-containing protein [Streptosporangium sp. NPDC050855]|uniref:coiled-coil domain-containing protein n=1 Tax=Streptosporangium sp. NPDC050855 TaxID=3366194 RepID=UPI0037B52498
MRPTRPVALAAMLAALLLVPVAADAAPGRAARPNPEVELRKLTKEAAQINKDYRGQVQSLEETRVQASKATSNAKSLKRALADAETDVVRFVQTSYMGAALGDGTLLSLQGDAGSALSQAATMSYLASRRTTQLNRVKELIRKARAAEKAADAKIVKLKKDIADLKSQRIRIERLLAKYGFQTPSGSGGLTPRTITMRNTVLQNFPMPYGYGCLRPGDPGDHGSGRACDFMMSTGGRVPTPDALDRGNRLAQWAIDNGQKYGVMYIIWQQRYYDVRTGAGWRMMSNRGGNTANHIDHVHISMF